MGSPEDERDRIFATWDWAGVRIAYEVRHRFDAATDTVLDVGAGWGKYRTLLPDFVMDAVEVWVPYIAEERLHDRYRQVFACDVMDLPLEDPSLRWSAIILGDVFEHLTVDQATALLPRLLDVCEELFVAVPFHYEQGVVNDNPYEVHQQADLDEEVMSWRYRHWLRPLYVENDRAIYVSNREAV